MDEWVDVMTASMVAGGMLHYLCLAPSFVVLVVLIEFLGVTLCECEIRLSNAAADWS